MKYNLVLKGVQDSSSFAEAMWSSGLLMRSAYGNARWRDASDSDVGNDTVSDLSVSFVGGLTIPVQDLAVVALLVRRYADAGAILRVQLPRRYGGKPSGLAKVLRRIGFVDLLRNAGREREWGERLSLSGATDPIDDRELGLVRRRYVQMQWIDSTWFDRDSTAWLESRVWLKPKIELAMKQQLAAMGFTDADSVGAFLRTMLLELGSNAVVHSAPTPGDGLAVICGHVSVQEGQLDFTVTDIGAGIPSTLGSSYLEWSSKQGRDFHSDQRASIAAGTVRFAFENFSTSRDRGKSIKSATSDRGLGVVRDIISEGATLAMRSDGGLVRVWGTSEVSINDCTPLPGAQAVGAIPREMRVPRIDIADAATKLQLPSLTPIPVYDLGIPTLTSLHELNVVGAVDLAMPDECGLLFDLGASVEGHKSVETLLRHSTKAYPDRLVVLWNVDSPWGSLEAATRIAREHFLVGGVPPLVVRSHNDARFLGISSHTDLLSIADSSPHAELARMIHPVAHATVAEGGEHPSQLRIAVDLESFLETSASANSEYLEQGFTCAGEPNGFFRGKIKLLSGGEVDRYFALKLSLRASPASLVRWVNFARAAVEVFRASLEGSRRLVIIGFTDAVSDILAEIAKEISGKVTVVALNLYDVPSREEIRGFVSVREHVVLVTDVVSSGSLVGAICDLIQDVGASILGVVSIADAQRDFVVGECSHRFGRKDVPYRNGSRLRHGSNYSANPDEQMTFRVDQVSSVPIRFVASNFERDNRVTDALRLTANARVTLCGHIVDGARHGSVYVDMSRLLEFEADAIRALACREIDRRLQEVKWNDFRPTAILRPSGVSRVQYMRADGRLLPAATARSATESFSQMLMQERWSQAKAIDVPRIFDHSGHSRSTLNLDAFAPESGADVVVVDDGMWSGNTTQSLAQLAANLGARRILLVPLLCRVGKEQAQYWESLSELRGTHDHSVRETEMRKHELDIDNAHAAKLCYVLPLILPVPYYEEHSCPYELTIGRLRNWSGANDVFSHHATQLAQGLEGRRPEDAELQSDSFTSAWLGTRVAVELASEDENELDRLVDAIKAESNQERLVAIFSLFLQDWRLLGRASLRRRLASTVRDAAMTAALSSDSSAEVRSSSISLLRSLFPDRFAEILPRLAEYSLSDPTVLDRMIFHVGTLAVSGAEGVSCQMFLRGLSLSSIEFGEARSASERDARLREYQNSFATARSILFGLTYQPSSHSLVDAAVELKTLLQQDTTTRHETLGIIHGLAASGTDFQFFDAQHARSYFVRWRDEHRPFIVSKMLPAIEMLRGCLVSLSREDRLLPDAIGSYLVSVSDPRRGILADLGLVEAGLEVLAESRTLSSMNAELTRAAKRLEDYLIGSNSALLRYLRELGSITVADLIDAFRSDLTARFSLVRQELQVEFDGVTESMRSYRVFGSGQILHSVVRSVADNVEKHAFRLRGVPMEWYAPIDSTRRVRVVGELNRSEQGTLSLTVRVFNNGTAFTGVHEQSRASRRLDMDLHEFGGAYAPVHPVEGDWSAVHQARFLVW